MSERSDLEEELNRLRRRVAQLESAARPTLDAVMLRAAEELSHLGAFVWRADTDQLVSSAGLQAILGVRPEELLSVDAALDLVVPNDRKRLKRLSLLALRGGDVNPTQFRLMRAGEIVHVMGQVRAHVDTEGRLLSMAGALMDVTGRRQVEGRLLQSQKMEAISTLAAGVAEDFNAFLEVIEGHVDLINLDPNVADKTRVSVSEISSSVGKCRDVIERLLAFSGKQDAKPSLNDVRTLVGATTRTLKRMLDDEIELRVVCEPDPCMIRIDPVQFEQAVICLGVNARDAMPDGGELSIEVARVTLDGHSSRMYGLPLGIYCRVQVRDTGMGMDEETCARAFEPFFSTKPKGTSSGLGLSIVHGIVLRADGTINVESTPDEGTVFSLFLPASTSQPEMVRPVVDSRDYPTGTETILLVEDGEQARTATKDHLERAGYDVLAAPDGEAALELAEIENVAIHLLLTDVMIPGMSGPELAGRLQQKFPRMSVIFMSGYTERFVFRRAALHSDRVSLHKPFSMGELLSCVREQLDRLRKP